MSNTENKNESPAIFLGPLHPESGLARLSQRLAADPIITNEEAASFLLEHKQGGGYGNPDGARMPLFFHTLAQAVTGQFAHKPDGKRGSTYYVPGIKDAIKTDGTNYVPVPIHIVDGTKVEAKVEPEAPKAKAPAAPAIREDRNADGERLIFPETPVNPALKAKWVQPDWHDDMVAALESGRHVSIAGPPGVGKSTGAEQHFIKKGQPFVVINGEGGVRGKHLEGTPGLVGGETVFKVAAFAAAAINGWAVIFNEVNACEADALLLINGVIEVPNKISVNGKTYDVHPDFRLVVTYNPGLVGTKPLPQSFKDRFFPVKLGFFDDKQLRKVLVANGMPKDAAYADRLIKFAHVAWDEHVRGNIRYQISPRRLFDTVFILNRKPETKLADAIERGVVAAVDSHSDQEALRRASAQTVY